ncbi:MAG: radical SAM protein [Spirochaetales bacterium]|uniref:Radical SAM protein n=1 Tax=Candidatus Thalassospirochaeta sargassi TaxID=3119039 RepID=A0AAJ1IAG6_9SPIO|nr:radical SAM protein [Spirochaetales bacterium]
MKKLLLINPVRKKSGYLLSRFTRFPPLGLAYLAGVTPDDWDVKILDENFDPFVFEEADLVGITAFTSSINRAYEISGMYKNAGIPVVLGGIHASMIEDEVLNFADAVVAGECESVWPELLKDFEAGNLKRVYRGERIDLSDYPPRPRRDLLDERYVWQTIQTSRGCPFNCTFCSVTKYLGSGFRQRSAEDVLDELEEMPGRYVAFVDDNLIGSTAESRDRARKIFQGMIDRKLKKRWWMQTSINAAADEDLLRLAARSGCYTAFIGFETIDQAGLKAMHKGVNVKIGVDGYKSVVNTFHKFGIGVMGGFIIGNDFESAAYYRRFGEFLVKSGIDICQISILTPLPGTDLYQKMKEENKLVDNSFPKDWEKYRLSRVVHRAEGVEADMIYRGDNYLKKKIYTGFGMISRMIKSALALRRPFRIAGILILNRAMKRSWMKSYYYSRFPHDLGDADE